MGLELVGGTQGEGQGLAEGQARGPATSTEAGRPGGDDALSAAARALVGVRLRLTALADRVAELRRGLDAGGNAIGDSRPPSA